MLGGRRTHKVVISMREKAFAAALVMLVISLAAFAFLNSDYFAVTTVTVDGNLFFTDEEVRALTGLDESVNLFRFDERAAKAVLERSSKIERADVTKHMPSRVHVSITERIGVVLVPYYGSFCEVDSHGIVMAEIRDLSRVPLPVLVGVQPTYVAVGERIQPPLIGESAALISRLGRDALRLLREIQVGDGISAVTRGGVRVVFGSPSELSLKGESLVQVIRQSERENHDLSHIDVTVPEYPSAR